MLIDPALFLQHPEDGRRAECGFFNSGAETIRQTAGDVFKESSAGDMADALYIRGFDAAQHRFHIDDSGLQKGLPQRAAQFFKVFLQIGVLNVEHLADEGVAVGVKTTSAASMQRSTGFT